MSFSSDDLFDRYYYSRTAFVDGTYEFHRMIAEAIKPGASVLEIGAGPSNPTSDFLAAHGRLTGIDVSEEVHANKALSASFVYDGSHLPFAAESFDGCVSNFVLEHVEHPAEHFAEVARVLRPGAAYVFRTPNLFHYVAGTSSILPHSAHVRLANRLRSLSEDAHDPWQTFYRANTRRAIRRHIRATSLEVAELRMV